MRYKVSVTYEFEIDATNAVAAYNFASKASLHVSLASLFPPFSGGSAWQGAGRNLEEPKQTSIKLTKL